MSMLPTSLPASFVPIFNFKNSRSKNMTVCLELAPFEIESSPGDKIQVFVYEQDDRLH